MKSQKNVILIGGPESGKSNYLFRSWIAIERGTGSLVQDGLPADLGYLHDGASILLDGKFAPRTSRDTREMCEIPIAFADDPGSTATLLLPDANGELWLDLYQNRELPEEWERLLTEGCGIVLMIRAGSPKTEPALDWVTCERLYGKGIEPQETGVPTQVLLVDWLQILRFVFDQRLGYSRNPRLSVVVSAWDAIPADRQHMSPTDYIETEFPLFSQFFCSDSHRFDAKIYGLSIFGGDFEHDPAFRDDFLESDVDSLGYVVVDSNGSIERDLNILSPILWALGK